VSRQPTANAGKRLGRYVIQRELGRGGMGVVYVAEDTNTGRQVALKTTAVAALAGGEASRHQRRQRFVREVQALTQVSHDNVVHVIDAGEADDPDLGWLLFYSMQYVEGETLAQLVRRYGALDPGAAAAVLMQVAAGLGAAHRSGIVHRDVKPANIFISLDRRALIGDFGICKIEGQTQITRRDQLVGTPNYLAPEQILGEAVSPATDVFALGALYYVIAMNRPLRAHVDAAALLSSAQGDDPKNRMLSEGGIPQAIRVVIARCLERDPKARWQDGQRLAEALADHATLIPAVVERLHEVPNESEEQRALMSSASTADMASASDHAAFADPTEVEAAARALLGEVERRESAPLPVAKTESTAMFNLRVLEEEHNRKIAEAKSIAQAPPPTGSMPARPEAALPIAASDDTSLGTSDEAPPDDTHEPPQPAVRTFEVAATIEGSSVRAAAPRQRLSRPAWIGIAGAGGALLGIILVVTLAGTSHSTARAGDAIDLAGTQQSLLCPDTNDNIDVDRKQAQELIDKALRMETEGADAHERRAVLLDAIHADAHNAQAFFELGRALASIDPSGARSAFKCVCIVNPQSFNCGQSPLPSTANPAR
jgi:serine/threonine-protein kinase